MKTVYIYQLKDWPHFTWDNTFLSGKLGRVRNLQGRLMGRMFSLGFPVKQEALLLTLTLDVLKSAEIEGEMLNYDQVRSSIARYLGIEAAGLVPSARNIDGIVEMMIDATGNYKEVLTVERLSGWHAALFPTGRSGPYKITVGNWRKDANGPMQVVSGRMGKEKVHFQAPGAELVPREMQRFLKWVNEENRMDPVLKAAVAHLWFVTIHPFDDGNGRIARAIADMLLARSDESSQRFYSVSAQIMKERNAYYDILEKTQSASLDISPWLDWFLDCMEHALLSTTDVLQKILYKAEFWKSHSILHFNERQRLMLNKLLDGFEGNLKSSKWAKIAKCSTDTALRDIKDLIKKGILKQESSGGRSINYTLTDNGDYSWS